MGIWPVETYTKKYKTMQIVLLDLYQLISGRAHNDMIAFIPGDTVCSIHSKFYNFLKERENGEKSLSLILSNIFRGLYRVLYLPEVLMKMSLWIN